MLTGGTDAEFSAFAARDGGQLVGFAFLLTGNRHDAEDLAQQALVRTAARWHTARESPVRYSRTVVLNLVRDRWRVRQRQAETLSVDVADLVSVPDAAEATLDRQLLLRACRLLPLHQRAVLVLRFWEDRSIEVADLATGAVRTWTIPGDGLLTNLTWDTAGRRVAYFYVGDSPRTSGLWRLDTEAPGSALLSGRRLLPQIVGPDQVEEALLTPDGQHIIASVTLNNLSHVTDSTVVGGIVQVDAQTGQPLQNLLAQRATPSGPSDATVTACQLQSADPTGDHLLVNWAEDFGRLDHARFTTLTGAGDLSPTASAW